MQTPSIVKDVGVYQMKGRRDTMEDIVVVSENFDIFPDHRPCLFVAVYDGHSGKDTAEYLAKNLHTSLKKSIREAVENCGEIITTTDAFVNAFVSVDKTLKKMWESKGSSLSNDSGSTANICLITADAYVCANVGDCRCVLQRENSTLDLSVDHKADLHSEQDRIVSAGGYVFGHRVCGVLAITRAFGDFFLKRKENVLFEKQPVVAIPDVTITNRLSTDRFLIVASDGLWDKVTSEQAVKCVQNHKDESEMCNFDGIYNAKGPAMTLGNLAFRMGSGDNISCIVVYL